MERYVQCQAFYPMLKYLQSQEYDLGSYLRQTYLNPASSSYIQGIKSDVADINQLYVRADAGGGNVILDSAYVCFKVFIPQLRHPI